MPELKKKKISHNAWNIKNNSLHNWKIPCHSNISITANLCEVYPCTPM